MSKLPLLAAVLALGALMAGSAPAQSESPGEAAQRATRQLSAVRALQIQLEQKETYRARPEDVAVRIRAAVLDHRKHDASALERARADQRARFGAIYSQSIRDVAQSLDPNNKFELRRWLRGYADKTQAGQKMSLKTRGQHRHEEYLASEQFKRLYADARKQVAEEQVREIQPGLGKDEFPTIEDIEGLYATPTARARVVRAGKHVLVGDRKLLEEAEQQAEALAARMVANGLQQLEEQLRVLERALQAGTDGAKPRALTAHTPAGIEKALEEELHDYLRSLNPPPGFKAYPEFPVAKVRRRQLALERFDKRVADAAARVIEELDAGKLRLSEDWKGKIRQRILGSPEEHHTYRESMTVLEPLIREGVFQAREWICRPLVKDAQSSPAKGLDPDNVGEVLRKEIEGRLETKNTLPHKEWKKFSGRVREEYNALLVSVRKEIARRQAEELCPVLAKGDWKPDEDTILVCGPKDVDVHSLRGLDVWKGPPPVENILPEETWDFWIEKAREALSLGREALHQQRWLVGDLARVLVPQIKDAPKGGTSYWVKVYRERVATRWRESPLPAASRHKELFKATLSEIDRVVGEALGRKAKEAQIELVENRRQEIKDNIERQRRNGERPVFQPHYDRYLRLVASDWEKRELAADYPDLLPGTTERMRGIVQEYVRAQIEIFDKNIERAKKALKDAGDRLEKGVQDPQEFIDKVGTTVGSALNGQEPPGDIEQQLERLAEQAKVLYWQNRLVDEARPAIEAGIDESIRRREDPTIDTWEREYIHRVKVAWRQNDLSRKQDFEEILPAVRQRIHGIVSELIKAKQPSIDKLILLRQLELVARHEKPIVDQIKADSEPIRSAYVDRYAERVKRDWQNSEEDRALSRRHSELMRETIDQIRGIVAKHIPEPVAPPPESGPSGLASTGTARYDTKGAQKDEMAKGPQTGDNKGPVGADKNGGDQSGGQKDGTGGASQGQGGTASPERKGRDAMVPRPEKIARSIPWLLLLIALACLAWSVYYLYRRGKRGGVGTGGTTPDGPAYDPYSHGGFFVFFMWLRLQPLFWRFVRVYRDEAPRKLRALIEARSGGGRTQLPAVSDRGGQLANQRQ